MNRHITKIRLENFQGYKDETIELKPGLNLLIGTSDAGKSAVLRAISFVLHNIPRGNGLIRYGETETRVTIEFSDGTSVTKIKGDRNAVAYTLADGTMGIDERIDKGYPDHVLELLGNPPIDPINGPISYAGQLSKMFLVDLSPTELPRSLSYLTGIDFLEQCAKELMQNYKQLEKECRVDEKELAQLQNEEQSYSYLPHCEAKVKELSDAVIALESTSASIAEMSGMLDDPSLDVSESDLQDCVRLSKDVKATDTAIKKLLVNVDNLEKMCMLVMFADANITKEALAKTKKVLTELDALIAKMENLSGKIASLDDMQDVFLQYDTVKNNGMQLSGEYKQYQEQLKTAEEDLEAYHQMLVDNNIQCQYCGSILQ